MTAPGSREHDPVDRDLVSAFLRGRDEAAFRELYRTARRLVRGDAAAAEELVQTTWVRAVSGLPGFRWGSSLPTWLIGILINCSKETMRGRLPGAAAPERGGGPGAGNAAAAPEKLDLERAVLALPDGYREVLVLHDIEGYNHREISGLLGISEGTSRSQLSHARNAVRRRLGGNRLSGSSEEA